MFPFFQHNHLWLLIAVVFIRAPRIIVRPLRDGGAAGYGRPPRAVVGLKLFVIVFVWYPSDAILQFLLFLEGQCRNIPALLTCKNRGLVWLYWSLEDNCCLVGSFGAIDAG